MKESEVIYKGTQHYGSIPLNRYPEPLAVSQSSLLFPSFSSLTLMELLNKSGNVVTFFRLRDRLRERVRNLIFPVVRFNFRFTLIGAL